MERLIHAPELLHAPYVFAKLAIFPFSATGIKQNNDIVSFTGSKKSEGDIESMKTAHVQLAEGAHPADGKQDASCQLIRSVNCCDSEPLLRLSQESIQTCQLSRVQKHLQVRNISVKGIYKMPR